MKIPPFFLPLLASTACAFAPNLVSSNRPATRRRAPNPVSSNRPATSCMTVLFVLYDRVEEAIADAQRVCAQSGPESRECRVAWDIVEELEAADSHRGGPMQGGGGGINMNPDGQALMSSFNILLQKIDGKMDQALATTEKLAELGLRDQEIADLHQRAYEMKEAVWNARRSMGQ
jgi:hypothetical protein